MAPQRAKRSSTRMSLISSSKASLAEPRDDEQFQSRLREVQDLCPSVELEAFASLAMWRFCPDKCCPEGEEHECRFQPITCANEGCDVRCCQYAIVEHEACCSFKLVSCQACGE